MKVLNAIGGGLAGAAVLTAVHQIVKKADYKIAPRMDLLGMESILKIFKQTSTESPSGDNLYYLTLAADILSNAVYYSMAGIGKKQTLLKGAALGLAAGVGAVYLPGVLGLKTSHSDRTPATKALAVAYYLAGGLVAAGVISALNGKSGEGYFLEENEPVLKKV